MPSTINTLESVLASLEVSLAELVAFNESWNPTLQQIKDRGYSVLRGEDSVIQIEGGFLTFDETGKARLCSLPKATQFSFKNAAKVAAVTTNGNGQHASAVKISDVLPNEIRYVTEMRDQIAKLIDDHYSASAGENFTLEPVAQ